MSLPPLPALLPLPTLPSLPAAPVLMAPLPPLAMPPLPPPNPWHKSPETNPTRPGWCLTRWRAEFPESRLYWDGVWWCVEIDNEMHQLRHVNIKNWSCEWKPI